ncbi:MAG: hypothetical protein LBR68_08020, partial [Lachnoclostridium sp.]|nr:hypothetical protein [Lachnoclostridium sp.]
MIPIFDKNSFGRPQAEQHTLSQNVSAIPQSSANHLEPQAKSKKTFWTKAYKVGKKITKIFLPILAGITSLIH